MAKEGFDATLSEEMLKKIAESEDNERRQKNEWYDHHKERHPSYTPTNEEGAFVGLIGFRTPVGVSIHPYYITESGVYFRETKNSKTGEKGIKELNMQRIQEKKSAVFYTRESFLGDEPDTSPGVLSSQGVTPSPAK